MSNDNNREHSAIDAIYKILDKLDTIEKRITIIDNNIKLLNNKVNKLESIKDAAPAVSARAVIPVAKSTEENKSEDKLSSVKVFGRIKNKQKKPIKDINVRIYDEKGTVVKSRITDSNGYWEARISPGDYGVEYDPSSINKRLRPVNFKVTITPEMKELDISEINKL